MNFHLIVSQNDQLLNQLLLLPQDEDILSTVRRRLGRFKKKKRPWTKVDGEKLVLLYGRWRGLPEATRAELIVTDQRSTFHFRPPLARFVG